MFDPFKKLAGIETQTEKKERKAWQSRMQAWQSRFVFDPSVTPHEEKTLSGHSSCAMALTLLSDGRLASGGADNTIELWNVLSGACEVTLFGHSDYVLALTLLSDGRLASGSRDNRIKLWNVSSGACEHTLSGHGYWVTALTLLSDGRLASGSLDTKIKLWNVKSGVCEVTLSGHSNSVYALTLLSDGRLASGSSDKTIKLWNVSSGVCEATLSGHSNSVNALTLLTDGRLASGSVDNTIKLWNVKSGSCEVTLSGHSSYVYALTLLSDGRLASGSLDKTIKLWNVGLTLKLTPPVAAERTLNLQQPIAAPPGGEPERAINDQKDNNLIEKERIRKSQELERQTLEQEAKKRQEEQAARVQIKPPVDQNEFTALQQELAVFQERMKSISTQTLTLSDNEKMMLQQRLVKDQSKEQRLQERYTIESDLPRRQYYYLIQTHVSELMVASLGIGSGYIDVNHSQSATVVGWICDGLSSAFPGISILTTIVNAGVNCLDIKYRKFLLEKVRLFGHTINEAEILGEELARLFVRAHYHAKTIFSEAQADKDAATLIKVIVKVQPAFERNAKIAEQLVQAVFTNNPCLDALPNTYVVPTKVAALPMPVSINLMQPVVIIPPSMPGTPSVSTTSPAPLLTMEEMFKRLQEVEAENRNMKSEINALKVSKQSPKETPKQDGGLILKSRIDEMEADSLKASHVLVERRMGYVEDHVGVVSEETQRLREEVAELKRHLKMETSSVSQVGMYANNACQQQHPSASDTLKSELFSNK